MANTNSEPAIQSPQEHIPMEVLCLGMCRTGTQCKQLNYYISRIQASHLQIYIVSNCLFASKSRNAHRRTFHILGEHTQCFLV